MMSVFVYVCVFVCMFVYSSSGDKQTMPDTEKSGVSPLRNIQRILNHFESNKPMMYLQDIGHSSVCCSNSKNTTMVLNAVNKTRPNEYK